MWAVTVPIGLVAAFILKLPVLWVYILINTDEIIKLPAVFWNFGKYKWLKNLTRTDGKLAEE
jgi:Na+-driven multidrug efflux pump